MPTMDEYDKHPEDLPTPEQAAKEPIDTATQGRWMTYDVETGRFDAPSIGAQIWRVINQFEKLCGTIAAVVGDDEQRRRIFTQLEYAEGMAIRAATMKKEIQRNGKGKTEHQSATAE